MRARKFMSFANGLSIASAALALGACSLHLDGSSDVNVASMGIKTQPTERAPASMETPRLAPDQSTAETATGQVGAPGGGFDRKSVRVRDSANPYPDIKAEAEMAKAHQK